MTPDRTNYEIWLIDYLDGKLTPTQVVQLMAFLDENPDIKEEYNEITTYTISPGDKYFHHKNSLKKSVSDIYESQFDYLCVEALENDLSVEQAGELNEVIAGNPEKKKTYEVFQKLKLIAPEIKYTNKFKLKKLTAGQWIGRVSAIGLSAAATIAIIISLFNTPLKRNTVGLTGVANSNLKESDTFKTDQVKIAGNISAAEKKEIKKTSVKIISQMKKAISVESTSLDTVSSSPDSAIDNSFRKPVLISTIDYKQNVNVAGVLTNNAKLKAINIPDIPVSETEEKPGFNEFIAKLFREKIFKSSDQEKGQLKAYEIADAGINGLNKLLGWQMSLKKNKDEKGVVKSVYFSSRLLKFNAPVRKVALLP